MAAVTVLTMAVSGCTGDEDGSSDQPPGGQQGAPAAPAAVVTDVRFGSIHGQLPRARRPAVRDRVQQVFDQWVEAAYLGEEWPRTDFAGAFAGFTDHARARARRDAALLSNQAVGARVDGVEPLGRLLRVDVVAARGRAAGATARFRLRFRTSGEAAGTTVVRGRLFLTPAEGTWQIFGYDVSRQEA